MAVPKFAPRWWLLLALLLGAAALAGFGRDRVAEAHALLVRADPPVNSQLRQAPEQMTLYFSEPLEQKFSRVSAVNQDGEEVSTGFEFLPEDNAAMRVSLAPVGPGFITVTWETVSTVDGHRISGSYPITILNEDGSLPAGQPVAGGASLAGEQPHPVRVAAKWVLLIAGSVLAGATVFLFWVLPGLRGEQGEPLRSRFGLVAARVGVAMVVLLAVAGVVELLFQALDIDASVGDTLATQWGERWLLRNLLLVPAAFLMLSLLAGFGSTRLAAFGTFLIIGLYFLLTASVSHAAAGAGSTWAVASDFMHLLASSVWIGALGLVVLLIVRARSSLPQASRYPLVATALQRFSIVAAVNVAILMLTGTINALIEIDRFADLVETGYGRALSLKLLLLVPLLGVAGYNAYLLRPDFAEAAATENPNRERQNLLQELESQLNRRIRYEVVIALAVLAVVALLVQLTPSRGRVDAPSQGAGEYVETMEADDLQATLVISPNQPGFNTFEVYLAGGVDVVENLRLEFVRPDGFASDSRLNLDASNPPTFYIGQGPYLAEAGDWTIILNVRRNVGTDLRLPFSVSLAPEAAPAASRQGDAFDSPIEFDTTSVVILAVVAVASVAIVAGTVPRPGLPEGYLGWLAAEAAYRMPAVNLRPAWTLAALLAGGIGLGLLLGSHVDSPLSREEASRENPIEATEESIARGRMLFANNCTICHGESGRGDGPAAATLPIPPANLYDHIPFHPDQFFFGVISKGLGGVMPAFEDQISEEDRWNILNYLRDTFTSEPVQQ